MHRDFVRSLSCLVCGNRPVEFAHVRAGTDGGTGMKPSDWWGVPLCHSCHAEQHRIGEPAFERKHEISMRVAAERLAMGSPDLKMRIAMGEWGA